MTVSSLEYEKIMKKIRSEDEDERRYAAHLLGETKERRGIKPLIKLLSDSSGAVKEAAAEALRKIDGEEVIQELISLLYIEEVNSRNIAIEILGEIGEEAIEPLSLLLKDKDHDIRKFACDIMGNIGSPKAVPCLISALDDPHINVSCSAAEALGNIKDKRATPALVRALKDKKWLAYNAVEALGKIKDQRAMKPLMQLTFNKDPLILFALIKTFGEIGDVRMVEYLLSCLDSATLRNAAVEALAKIARREEEKVLCCLRNYPEKLNLLRKFLKESCPQVKKDGAFLIGVAKDKEAVPLLFSLLSREEIREEAMRALLKIDPELTSLPEEEGDIAREILEVFLYDNDENLREAAGKALKRFSPVTDD